MTCGSNPTSYLTTNPNLTPVLNSQQPEAMLEVGLVDHCQNYFDQGELRPDFEQVGFEMLVAVVGVLVAELVAVVGQVEGQLQVPQVITPVMAIELAADLRLFAVQIYYFYWINALLADYYYYSELMAQ